MAERYDIVIVGGGLTGAALALALRESAWRVAVVEPSPPRSPEEVWDARIFAFSPGNVAWLRQMGAWNDPLRAQPVHAMRIAGDAGGRLEFDALEAGLPELAFIAENSRLQYALWQALAAAGNVNLIQAQAEAVAWGENEVSVQASIGQADAKPAQAGGRSQHRHQLLLADGRRLQAELLVGADGAHSWLRGQAGIGLAVEDYHHVGVVANFETERPHRGTAYQWFRPDGVLAYLPLPGNRISIVWSTPPEHAEELKSLPSEAFGQRVKEAGGGVLGELRALTPPQGFPLKRRRAEAWVKPGLVLIGDAAHTVHPLAGQGVNLGFRDARLLAAALQDAGRSPGEFGRLQAYALRRTEDVASMQWVTGSLKKLFGNTDPGLRWVRNTGLVLTDRLDWLKQALMRHAIQ